MVVADRGGWYGGRQPPVQPAALCAVDAPQKKDQNMKRRKLTLSRIPIPSMSATTEDPP